MYAKWKFPSAGGGNISGLNDTGITQFKSVPIQSVTKETLQDSLDARSSSDEPTVVKFSLFNISKDELPDATGLTNIFKLGKSYWYGHNQQDAEQFFAKGLETLQQDEIKVMAIQDYNTKGLSNIGGENGQNSGGWMALVRSTGITEKGPMSSGSFGIGKHAPFAASYLQTVMYGTVNEEDKFGFQGVSKIASFLDDDNDMTQGTGYYGFAVEKDFKPIINAEDVPKKFRRTKRGTDKFIIGFAEVKDWQFEVLKEAISSFMLAIAYGHLEVHIDDKVLNSETLKHEIGNIAEIEPDNILLQYYEALTHPESKPISKKFLTDKGIEEEINLHLIAREGFKKRIVLYRGTGMQIYDRGHFRTPIEFAGLLVVKGRRLNEVLRKMEPPTHDKWDPNLFKENIPYAKRLLSEINTWMNEETRNLIDLSNVESIELKGLENLLPDVTEKESPIVEINKKSMKQKLSKVKKKKKQKVTTPPIGLGGEDGGDGIISTPPNKKGDAKGNEHKKAGGSSHAKISRARAFCIDYNKGLYNVRFWPSTDGERTFLISSIGENNMKSELKIVEAIDMNTKEKLQIIENEIGPLQFTKNEVVEIQVMFKTRSKLALEVQAQ
ncbi:hypothetical protein [Bacillus sp. 179-C3.3 HS]|uniref:hypothetical protein n=1 Tax=Bacillus sp. 179-C3.3 HS TaxID=3232162 RepID=UPI0039A08188